MEKITNKRMLSYIIIMLIFNTLFSQNETKEITLVFYRKIAHSPLRIPFFEEKENFSFRDQSDTMYCFYRDKPDTVKARDGIVVVNYIRQTITKYKMHFVTVFIPEKAKEFKEFILYLDEKIYKFRQNATNKQTFDLYSVRRETELIQP